MKVKSVSKNIFIMMTLIFIAIFLGLFLLSHAGSGEFISNILKEHKVEFMIWRYTLVALLIFFWPYFIRFIGIKKEWNKEAVNILVRSRIYVLLFFLIIEVFIVNNFLAFIINIF